LSRILGINATDAADNDFEPDRDAWTSDDIDTLFDLWIDGNSPGQIAKVMGRTTASVTTKASKRNLMAFDASEPGWQRRPCITCQVTMMSEHKGNRICPQ
jgi:hypothetical protein